ncbi:MAG: DUF1801 domain-containing protein, partial [uncultured Gemmatimonadetes bacterium]
GAERSPVGRGLPAIAPRRPPGGGVGGARRHRAQPAGRVHRDGERGDDHVRHPAGALSEHLQQAAAGLRGAGVAKEPRRAVHDGRLRRSRAGQVDRGGVRARRKEAGHGQVLHPLPQARRPAAGGDRGSRGPHAARGAHRAARRSPSAEAEEGARL